VGGTSKKQNWKGLSIAFLVIAVVWLFIAAAILLTNTRKPELLTWICPKAVLADQISVDNKLLSITEQDVFNVKAPQPSVDLSFSFIHSAFLT
jgi:hypothetical protein